MKFLLRFFALLCLLSLVACVDAKLEEGKAFTQSLPDQVDFNYHIRPILSDRCFQCHGPDASKRKAALRLDLASSAFAALERGKKAIVAGRPSKSELIHRINNKDPELQMPPPESKLQLSNYEKALLKKWIKQGAVWKEHWAFIPPRTPSLPKVEDKSWVQNPIDQFILAKLEKEGFAPSPRTDKETLIRRLSLDLTGLPPSIQEIDDFLADKSSEAYAQLVDRLLASPRYGERMAADWMDVARYADTHGYLDDTHREAWHWRDWVIAAFNKNLPYDQFITWQTAGDLLPNASKEQRLATGFQRMHRQNQEGGVIPEEYRVEYVADRVNTTAKAFLGLTMECARCHDHKYDPISQKEFYQMAAFFNSTFETGRAPIGYESGPTMLLTDEKVETKLALLRQKIQRSEVELREEEKNFIKDFINSKLPSDLDLEQEIKKGLIGHFSFDQFENSKFKNLVDQKSNSTLLNWKADFHVEGRIGKAIQFDEKNAVLFGGKLGNFERTQPFSFSTWIWLPELYKDASVFDNCDHKWHAYRGYELRIAEGHLEFRLSHNYPQNAIVIKSVNTLPIKEWIHLGLSYDGSSKADGLRLFLNGKVLATKTVFDNLYKSIQHDEKNDMVVMPYFGLKIGWRMNDPTLLNGKMDDLKIWNRELSALEMQYLGSGQTFPDQEMIKEWKWLQYQSKSAPWKSLKDWQDQENQIISGVPEAMVLGDLEDKRPTYVLERGVYDQRGEEVAHGTPQRVLSFGEDRPKNRLGLAQWLIDEANPLTARVAVNRIWQMLFGAGLVETPDDFGSQGALPSHPKLLDWLALQYVESGWDTKAIIRTMVLSATYQQSSKLRADLEELDPENIWLARGPRYRLSAEMIRDQALSASGLLVDQIGGKSIKPYQPKGLWAEQAFQAWANYVQDNDENLYRRTMYIYWKRNTPHPYMTTFDIPDRATCSVKRLNTSTPLQALMLLNYPQFVEAARALAALALTEGGEVPKDKLVFIFRRLTGKRPNQAELSLMKSFYQSGLDKFSKDQKAGIAFLSVGNYQHDTQLNSTELAAYTEVAHALMNTVNFYMKR